MEFFPRKKKSPPAVIIVALIDVLIVVLIFLLVTTTFKQQPALRLSLPESSQATTEGSSELAPVYVSVNQEGQVFLGANSEPVSLESLEAGLRTLVRDNPKVRVALEMDASGKFDIFIKVTDAIKAAGVKSGLIINTRKKEQK